MSLPPRLDPRLTQLVFPLNAFACAIFLQEGQVEYLHYGLFDQDHATLQAAQAQSTELILQRLPPRGSRILEIGIGLGTTAKHLTDLGYQVTGIAPDPKQVAMARAITADKVPFHVVTFEDYETAPGSIDLLLFQESSQYIQPSIIFSKSRRLLKPGGKVLILDQFSLRRTEPRESLLVFTEDFAQHGQGQGFRLTEHLDLSRQASPTLDYILEILDAHGVELKILLPHAKEEIIGLHLAVSANRELYRQGVLGYALFCFQH